MAKLEVKIRPDGQLDVHVDLPEGEKCDETDEMLRAVLAAMGVDTEPGERRPPQVEGQRTRTRVRR